MGAPHDKDKTIDAESIRDTNTVTGDTVDTAEYTAETIVVYNTLDKDAICQLQGSLDASTWMDIDTEFTVTASTNNYETVSDFFPCYRCNVRSATSPTSGAITIWIVKSGGG